MYCMLMFNGCFLLGSILLLMNIAETRVRQDGLREEEEQATVLGLWWLVCMTRMRLAVCIQARANCKQAPTEGGIQAFYHFPLHGAEGKVCGRI